MDKPKFEFYVINYEFNKKEPIMFNIFNNINVYEDTLKEVTKYTRNPKDYREEIYTSYGKSPDIILHGFEGFCKRLDSIIKWQEWGRCEYEIVVGDLFEQDPRKYTKMDCYDQAHSNIEIIAREVIYQYKKWLKENE